MIYVEVGLEHWHTGKRRKKYYTKKYEISDGLWNALNEFAINNELCRIGNWEYDEGKLYMFRLKELDDIFESNCNNYQDYELFDEIKKELFGGNIEINNLDFKYEFSKKIIYVNKENCTCIVKKSIPKKELERFIEKHHTLPPVETYEVPVSKRCIDENIVKANDIVLIRKLLDDSYKIVKILKSYEEEIEYDENEIDDILGSY